MACSQCEGIEHEFDRAESQKMLRRFRKRGPDRTTRMLIQELRAALEGSDMRNSVLLDIGAGIGAIHHELLDSVVARAVHIDASAAHLAAAREETERRGPGAHVELIHGDFVAMAESVGQADIVTLDRVICCYLDMEGLVSRAGAKASRMFGAVYPRHIGWMRIGLATINVVMRLKRSAFRVFLHEPAAIDLVLRSAGLERRSLRRTLGWEVVVYTRREQP